MNHVRLLHLSLGWKINVWNEYNRGPWICIVMVLVFHYLLEHLWLNSVFLQLPYWKKQASAATSASKQEQKHPLGVLMRLKSTSQLSCGWLALYLVPKVFCSAAGVRDNVRCSSILYRGCRRGHSGYRRHSGRWRICQCSTLSGHSLLSLVDRRCLPLSAEGNTDGDVPVSEQRTPAHQQARQRSQTVSGVW